MRPHVGILIAVLVIPALLHAQALADRVPADALFYFGWQGTEKLGPAYNESRLKGLADSSSLRKFYDDTIPSIRQRIAGAVPELGGILQALEPALATLWRHPTVVFTSGIDFQGPGGMVPLFGVICNAGADTEALRGQVQELLALIPPLPVEIAAQGESLVITFGYAAAALPGQAGPKLGSLADNKTFQEMLACAQADAALTLYIDIARALDQVDRFLRAVEGEDGVAEWHRIRDAFGIGGLKGAILTGGFEGKDWGCRSFVSAPAPRSGLLAMQGRPLTDDLLQRVPVTATWLCVASFSMADAFTAVRAFAGRIDAGLSLQIDQFLAGVEQQLGFQIERDFLSAFGSEWALYCDPASGSSGILGMTLVNRPRNP
ncbi:MAG: hypothetical protein L0Z55_09370, partial [Planctomycetes bacterium]|nr:hypothetical protein [Planctomycetota bacterium]